MLFTYLFASPPACVSACVRVCVFACVRVNRLIAPGELSACAAYSTVLHAFGGRIRGECDTDTHVTNSLCGSSRGVIMIRIVSQGKQRKDTDHTNVCAVSCIPIAVQLYVCLRVGME